MEALKTIEEKALNVLFIEQKNDLVSPNSIFKGLKRHLSRHKVSRSTLSFQSIAELQQKLPFHVHPDIILADIDQIGVHVLKILALRAQYPNSGIIVFSGSVDPYHIFMYMSTGINGYILKGTPFPEITKAIKDVNTGGGYLSPPVARVVFNYCQRDYKSDAVRLTNQEVQVMSVLAEGLTYQQTGERLGKSIHTVRFHLRNIYRKLKVNSNSEAIIKVFHNQANYLLQRFAMMQ